MRIRIEVQADNALTHWTDLVVPLYALRMTILADNIAEILRRAKRQQEVAEAVGISQSTISRLAAGSLPKPDNLIAIAKYAGVSVETLVETPIERWPAQDAETFKRARQKLGWSPSVLAQETYAIIKREHGSVSVTTDDIAAYEGGATAGDRSWLRFARMAFEEGGSAKQQDTAPRDDLAYVRQVDIRFAMGDGAEIEDYPATSLFPFNLDFLHGITSAPLDKLILATGHGDSMDPTIKEHDLALIDTTENRVALGDTIWALEYAGAGYIKRLRPIMQEGRRMIEVISDNKDIAPPFTAAPSDVHVVGKVILLIRRRP